MERLGLLGANWRAGAEHIERFTIPREARAEVLPRLCQETGVREMLYLATCNRVEVLFTTPSPATAGNWRARFFRGLLGRPPKAGEAERAFRAWGGEGAAEHLLLVAAGLDSAQLGEHEIRGQLREAHAMSRQLGLSGPRLDYVVETALRVARDVQHRTGLSQGRISIAEVGLDVVRERIRRRRGCVALIGISAMTERCAEELHADGARLLVINRTLEKARSMADRYGAEAHELDAILRAPEPVEAIILATGASKPVLDAGVLERWKGVCSQPPLLLDFGIPPDVDPQAAERLDLPYLGMDALNRRAETNRQQRHSEAAHARRLVDEALDDLRRQMAQRSLGPVLAHLGQRYRETADQGLDKLLGRELRELPSEERQALRRYAHNLAKRLAHIPIAGLRALATEHGNPALETFLTAADPALRRELDQARAREDIFAVDIEADGE